MARHVKRKKPIAVDRDELMRQLSWTMDRVFDPACNCGSDSTMPELGWE